VRKGLAAVAALVVAFQPAAVAAPPGGTWRGTFSLPTPLPFSVQLARGSATVTLPVGHPGATRVAAHLAGSPLRFALPGRPTPLTFDGRLRAGAIRGTVTQDGLRGRFVLRRGSPLDTGGAGVYRRPSGHAVAVVKPGNLPFLVDYTTGAIHGLFRRAPAVWDIGASLGVRQPPSGTLRAEPGGVDLATSGGAERAVRLRRRELEVRFASGGIRLAGTLSLPDAPGRHPGIVLVHGSGATPRTDPSVWAAYFASRGFAVLTYDKRGIGQSGGRYPGELASPSAVDAYAKDAAAAARFLARQPEVDPANVGLSGASQAGWIMPLAASREPAVRFLVLVSGPVVTQGEQGTYQNLTTEGVAQPSLSPAEILAEVRRVGRSGFDPLPAIGAMRLPALWLFGATDQHVPTALSVERLGPLAARPDHDFAYVVFPDADHFLIRNASGLVSEELASAAYAPGLFATVDDWLARHGITAAARRR
jgi:uncharacterized protein